MNNNSNFYAMLSRMKYVNRWGLMRNTIQESISDHTMDVVIIAHALTVIGNLYFGKELDEDRAALLAAFHDAPEILTGDMPTPVKYFNGQIHSAYKDIEHDATMRLLTLLPDDLRPQYTQVLQPGGEFEREKRLVKGADKLSAYIKCIEERKAGNREFGNAEEATLKALHEMELQEVEIFLEEFLPAYEKTLDEIRP